MKKILIGILACLIGLAIVGKAAIAPVLSSAILPLPPETPPEPVQPIVTNANEAGRFPVWMYHRIVDLEADWARSRENFKIDLEVLYERGYTLVNLSDFLSGQADIPPGRTPAVLTFDDSTQGQFNYLVNQDGTVEIDPDCAVGMLLEAYTKWPELGIGGTFYINANPFGQRVYADAKLLHLIELGFEIGNHTYTHPKLHEITPEKVQEEIALIQKHVASLVDGYQVKSLALPYGRSPKDRQLAVHGVWDGVVYHNMYILEVGSDPAYPPGHDKYNPLSIPRIAVTDELFYRWLNWLDAEPLRKYISDGDNTITTIAPNN